MAYFVKGQSGNPSGKPKGTKSKHFKKRESFREIVERKGKVIVRKAIELAEAGDPVMLSKLIDRLIPAIKSIDMPVFAPLDVKASDTENGRALLAAMARGDLSLESGASMLSAITSVARLEMPANPFGIVLHLSDEAPNVLTIAAAPEQAEVAVESVKPSGDPVMPTAAWRWRADELADE